jgi:CPA2 family monovalent cation:H+ antiporter-2
MVVGRSDYSLRAATEALPMRDAFAVLFFVSVGMLLDPRAVLQSPVLVTCALLVVLVGKPAAAIAVVLLMRYPMRVALAVGVALAQIGEFSFILAALAQRLGLLPAEAMNTIVATSIVSIVSTAVTGCPVFGRRAIARRRPCRQPLRCRRPLRAPRCRRRLRANRAR